MGVVRYVKLDSNAVREALANGGAVVEEGPEDGWGSVEEYKGRVLRVSEVNGYSDSDFYAHVWDGERVDKVLYATTRGWTYRNSATVDATPEVREAATRWRAEREYEDLLAAARRRAESVDRGKRVRVVRGRKVPVGTEGEVFWTGADRYNRHETRVGLRDDAGTTHWTSASNLEVVGLDNWSADEEDLRAEAEFMARGAY